MRAYTTLLKACADNDPRPPEMRAGGIDPLAIFSLVWLRIKTDGILIEQNDRETILSNLAALGAKSFFSTVHTAYFGENPEEEAHKENTMNVITSAAILFIENNIDLEEPPYEISRLQPKMRDMMGDCGGYTIAKFLSKRTPCSCLGEEMVYLSPKQGTCYHCGVTKPIREFKVCSRCRFPQYCSKICQKAHWPEHRNINILVIHEKRVI
jgi:hypothetical protein